VQSSKKRAVGEMLADYTGTVLEQRVGLVVGVATQILPRPIRRRCRSQVFISVKRV